MDQTGDQDKRSNPFEAPESDHDGLDLMNDLVPPESQAAATKFQESKAKEDKAASQLDQTADLSYYERIKQVREARGQSVQELAHCTRISAAFIDALEKGDLKALPGEVFARGFLRSLCKSLEIPDAEIMAGFAQYCDELNAEADSKKSTKPKKQIQSAKRANSASEGKSQGTEPPSSYRKFVAVAAMLVIATIAGIYVLKQELDREPSRQAVSSQVVDSKASTKAEVADTVVEQADQQPTLVAPKVVEQSPASQEVRTQPEVATVPSGQVIDLTVLNDASITLVLDGKEQESKSLTPDTYRFEFESTADVTIKDAAAVRIKYNGNDLGVLGKKGQIKKLAFKQDYSKKL